MPSLRSNREHAMLPRRSKPTASAGGATRGFMSKCVRSTGAAARAVAMAALAACSSEPSRPNPPLTPEAPATFRTSGVAGIMEQMIDAGAPAVLVEIRDGDEVWASAQGVQDITTETPADASMSVRVASITKSMVATIVLELVEEGEIALDDPIDDYLPALVDSPAPVTIRELLQHTSGMPDYVQTLSLDSPSSILDTMTETMTNDGLIDRANSLDWLFTPGTSFSYSNTNYIVLTDLIEEVTKKSIQQQIETRIARPAGLERTRIPNGTEMFDGHAEGYFTVEGLYVDVSGQNATLWSGAGGVESTVGDVNTFYRALMTGRYIDLDSLSEMLTTNASRYGLGIMAEPDPCGVPASSASPGATATPPPTTAEPGASDWADPDATGANATEPDATGAGATDTPATDTPPRLGTQPGDEDAAPQIGEPGMVYGHLGSGLGYRMLSMSSADGVRQVTVSWTASPVDYGDDPRLQPAYDLVNEALRATCPAPGASEDGGATGVGATGTADPDAAAALETADGH